MIILIGNQKGGTGKSTITLLLANYLTLVRKREVTILDMDYQQSLATKAEKARILENRPLYQVVPVDLEHFPSMKELLGNDPGQLVLIDLPGKMDDDRLVPVFQAAELILCPFAYDEFSVDSTVLFAMVVRRINETVALSFIPNRIKGQARYDTRQEVDKVLSRFGTVTPPLSDRIDFQRVTTLEIPLSLSPVILPVFDGLYGQFIGREERA